MKLANNYINTNYNKNNNISLHTNFASKKCLDTTSFTGKAQVAEKTVTSVSDKIFSALIPPIQWLSERKFMQQIGKWANEENQKVIKVKILSEENGKKVKRTIEQEVPVKKSKKLTVGSMIGLSIFLDGLYINRTLQSKKIEKDRKKTLAINQAITMVAACAGAILLDKSIFKATAKIKNKFIELNKKNIDKLILSKKGKTEQFLTKEKFDNAVTGIDIISTSLIIAGIYRFISPVIATPLADKVTKWMNKKD